MAIPILDNHIHLEPNRGRHVEAVKEFASHGGTHLIISHLPYEEIIVKELSDFKRAYDMTIAIKDRVNKETHVKAYATVGPYPAQLLDLQRLYGLDRAKEMMFRALEMAAEYVQENKAIAIGEVGRPHFPVSSEVWRASNDLMLLAMSLAKKTGCAIVLHTEQATPDNMREFAAMAEQAGLERDRVVKHYCPPLIHPKENFGLMPSVLAGKEAIKEALGKGTRFLMETDFLDDPKRPGAVMSINTVPKRTVALMQQGLMTEEQAYKIHVENPRTTYGSGFE